ncbi:MAG TPA: flagellar motor switch phosphatase FliY [Oscillatoriaceae cyanobacterium]
MSEQAENLNEFEQSTIGELGNVSMGSGATTLSMILNKTVTITSPEVAPTSLASVTEAYPAPTIIVTVMVTMGAEHHNVFLLSPPDTAVICDLMTGGDGSNPSPEIGDMQLSAVGEAMNQMLGTAATSMSQFFGRRVDITPPAVTFVSPKNEAKLAEIFGDVALTQINYKLNVEGLVDGDLVQLMTTASAHKLVEDLVMAADNPEAVAAAVAQEDAARKRAEAAKAEAVAPQTPAAEMAVPRAAEPIPEPVAAMSLPPSAVASANLPPSPVTAGMEAVVPPGAMPYQEAAYAQPPGYPPNYGYPPAGYPPPGYPPPGYGAPQGPSPFQADPVAVRQAQFAPLPPGHGMEHISGLDLIMDVPLRVTVELGRTRMQIRDVLDLGKGSVVELDKLVGEPVDMLVNGKLIAKGEVVVIDENFGIRVTDIVSPIERFNSLKIT